MCGHVHICVLGCSWHCSVMAVGFLLLVWLSKYGFFLSYGLSFFFFFMNNLKYMNLWKILDRSLHFLFCHSELGGWSWRIRLKFLVVYSSWLQQTCFQATRPYGYWLLHICIAEDSLSLRWEICWIKDREKAGFWFFIRYLLVFCMFFFSEVWFLVIALVFF